MSLVKCGKNYRSLNCLAWQGRQRKAKAPAGEVLHAAQVEQVPKPVLPGIGWDSQ